MLANFNTIWERHGAVVYAKELYQYILPFGTVHERDKQTDRQTNRPTTER